jgi:hypothetical protein
MFDLNKQKDELLEAVKAPTHKKTPSNHSLYFALIAADVIFGILDIGSGLTVYWITGIWFYGLLVFLAGLAPLLLFQSLYVRAFASAKQKRIAIGGAVLAVFSIIAIGILSAFANVQGVDGQTAELTVVIVIVVLAFIHALLLTGYFYIDDSIQSEQIVAQAIARAIQQARMIEAGDHVLTVTERAVNRRKEVSDTHGSPAALREVLRQMGWDDDGDGIPDWVNAINRKRPIQQMGAETERKNGNFTKPSSQQ